MKKSLLCLTLFVLMCVVTNFIQAQTYAYQLVKKVSKYGEVIEYKSNQKVYITFTDNKNSFYMAMRNGSRAKIPDAASGYASGYANRAGNQVVDPVNFKYKETHNGVKIYSCSRPIRQRNFNYSGLLLHWELNSGSVIQDYVTDYAKFNSDYSRINVVPNLSQGGYGVLPFGIMAYEQDITTFVFQRVEEPNVKDQVFY